MHLRIQFKIALLTQQILHISQPTYLSDLLFHYKPARKLRSSDSQFLLEPRTPTQIGSRGFCSFAPSIWNHLNLCYILWVHIIFPIITQKPPLQPRLAMTYLSRSRAGSQQHRAFDSPLSNTASVVGKSTTFKFQCRVLIPERGKL